MDPSPWERLTADEQINLVQAHPELFKMTSQEARDYVLSVPPTPRELLHILKTRGVVGFRQADTENTDRFECYCVVLKAERDTITQVRIQCNRFACLGHCVPALYTVSVTSGSYNFDSEGTVDLLTMHYVRELRVGSYDVEAYVKADYENMMSYNTSRGNEVYHALLAMNWCAFGGQVDDQEECEDSSVYVPHIWTTVHKKLGIEL